MRILRFGSMVALAASAWLAWGTTFDGSLRRHRKHRLSLGRLHRRG